MGSLKLIIIFFIIYIYMLSGVIFIYGQIKLGRFFYINSINFFDKFFLILVFMSLGGIPPLLGFLRKFIVLKILISFFNIFVCLCGCVFVCLFKRRLARGLQCERVLR